MTKHADNAEVTRVAEELRRRTMTKDGMESWLDHLLGSGNWGYDSVENVWVTPDKHHTGPGRGMIVIRPGGSWSKIVLPDNAIS